MKAGFTKTKVANSDLQTHADASARLKESRSKLDNDLSVEMTILFQRHSETLTNLSRHGTALLRSFQRNLHDLQRLQAIRAGERVAAPAVMDVDVNIRQKGGADAGFQSKSPAPEPYIGALLLLHLAIEAMDVDVSTTRSVNPGGNFTKQSQLAPSLPPPLFFFFFFFRPTLDWNDLGVEGLNLWRSSTEHR